VKKIIKVLAKEYGSNLSKQRREDKKIFLLERFSRKVNSYMPNLRSKENLCTSVFSFSANGREIFKKFL
jgi:hypothetical protein